MAPFPDEVDVFTGPHWRMKQLIGLYCDKLSKTNFSNNNDFRAFLQTLCATFKVFKIHEQIENEYIIDQLQQRSRTVYNVHSDNKLSEMLSLFEKGLRNVKSECEQLNYARQLKERLEAFTQDFLPHMKEEEEVFQPMLMEYFTYEELKAIKRQVIAQHCSQQQGDVAAEVLKGLNVWSQAEELHKAFKYSDHEKTQDEVEVGVRTHISVLPEEVLVRLFRYLGPVDLCRCSQVCSTWAELVQTGLLWRHLYPVRWARGDHYCGPPSELDQGPDEEWVQNLREEGRAFQEWDEDADVDETEEACEDKLAMDTVRQEQRLLNGMIQNLLPAVGSSVRTISLAYSVTVSSKMVRQILSLCPNLKHLDLTQTDITDSAFDSWAELGACRSLEHLDLSGCEKITDHTLKRLSLAIGDLTIRPCSKNSPDHGAKLLKAAPSPIRLLDEHSTCSMGRTRQAFIYKRRPGGRGMGCSPVWVLDPAELADIEDAADWSRRGGVSAQDGVHGSILELQAGGGSCCCRRGKRQSYVTGPGSSYWRKLYGALGDVKCGHSTCCSSDTAVRTVKGAQCSSQPTGGSAVFRTTCPSEGDYRTDQSGTSRSLRFLSLSGCYQVTDLGLRCLSQGGGLPLLEHLNLSGCLFITEVGLQELVSVCPTLNYEHFYYCDNINGNTHTRSTPALTTPASFSRALTHSLVLCDRLIH
ncbi:F-box/LRR-repeat protein 5 isoform X2 [Brachyhypopomus gauderio]|uniref:F-box/LRR-repeat protein 5 isoform X2 n=1 Tax=Brachyhypopomus gauderio TaxID=698409 RepID=UPI0040438980